MTIETLETQRPAAPVTATPEKTKPLKLSEAIRFGAMATEQIFGAFGDGERTCALGAAQVALGERPGDGGGVIDVLGTARVERPCGHGGSASVRDSIIHLNDGDHWPRERIASWLEELGL